MKPARLRVLLADDVPAALNTLERVLGDTCTIAAKAADGPSALDAIRHARRDFSSSELTPFGDSSISNP